MVISIFIFSYNVNIIYICRADYAFKPKDVHKVQKIFAPAANEPSETEITERIHRLSQMLTNKVSSSLVFKHMWKS